MSEYMKIKTEREREKERKGKKERENCTNYKKKIFVILVFKPSD